MVIAVGGAGGNIAAELQSLGALDSLGFAVQWIQIDTGRWHRRSESWRGKSSMVTLTIARLSTGGNPAIGRALARKHRYLLMPLLTHSDIVILVTGLGGGTGSGMSPYIARLARGAGAVTIAVVTLPFAFEGPRRHRTASIALMELRSNAEFVLTFSNQALGDEMGDRTLLTAIYAMQAQRIGGRLRDLLQRHHFD